MSWRRPDPCRGNGIDVRSLVVPAPHTRCARPLARHRPHRLLGLPVQSRPAGHRRRRRAQSGHARPEHPEHRVKVVASVVVDRAVGLYVLFVFATVALLLSGLGSSPSSEMV